MGQHHNLEMVHAVPFTKDSVSVLYRTSSCGRVDVWGADVFALLGFTGCLADMLRSLLDDVPDFSMAYMTNGTS